MKRLKFVLASIVLAVLSRGAFAADPVAPSPYDFLKRVPISVSSSGQSALGENSASDVPVLVRISESIPGFSYDDLETDGSDIVFGVESNGVLTEYPHEIEQWNPGGTSLVWVKVPLLSSSLSFNFYFGGGSGGTASSASVWSNYAGVWHLGESGNGGTSRNSTANGSALDGENTPGTACVLGRIGNARQISDTTDTKGVVGGIFVDGSQDCTKFGDTFTISGWFWHKDQNFYYDHVFYKRETSGGSGGIAIEWNTTNAKVDVRGGNSTCKSVTTMPICRDRWAHYVFVYSGTTCAVYADGEHVTTLTGIGKATDNTERWVFGNSTAGYGGANGNIAWKGAIDEVRMSPTAFDAVYIAAEYAAMSDEQFLSFGTATLVDPEMPVFSEAPSVVSDGHGGFVLTAKVASGKGDIRAVYKDVASGLAFTNVLATGIDVSSPQEYTDTPSLASGATYEFYTMGTAPSGISVRIAGDSVVYVGEVSVAAGANASELTMSDGSFVISRGTETKGDLVVAYAVSGADGAYIPLPGKITIPDGETTASVVVHPAANSEVASDVALALTLSPGPYLIGSDSAAEITIADAGGNPYVRYVSPSGDDSKSGLSIALAKATVTSALAALSELPDEGGSRTVYICDGDYAFDSGESAAITVDFPVLVTSLSGDASKVRITRAGTSKRIFHIDCGQATVSHLTLYGGTELEGGGAYITSNGGTLSDCVVTGCQNTAWNADGAVYVTAGRVARCTFTDNDYRRNGSALYAKGGVIESCLFAGNACGGAGAVCIDGAASLVNCTIVANTGSTCSGVKMSGSSGRAVNCAIFLNKATESPTGHVLSGNGGCFYNCAADGEIAGGSGCIRVQPSFRDAANGDWRLSPASPCIDAGLAPSVYGATSDTDLDGLARVVAPAVDIGCYENAKDSAECGFVYLCDSFISPATVSFSASSFGFEASPSFAWTITNSRTEEVVQLYGDSPVWQSAPTGVYSVRLVASDGVTERSYEVASCIQVAPSDIYASPGNESAAYPYDTPSTAAPDIATAVAAGVDGSTIHVLRGADGCYVVPKTINVEKGVRIIGETGNPCDIVCTNKVFNSNGHGIFMLNHPDAFVSGLTLADGFMTANNCHGAGVRIKLGGGTVSNCVVMSARSLHFDSYGAGVYMQAGLVTHTKFTGRFSTQPAYNADPSSKGVVAHVEGGRLENCLFEDITIERNSDGTSCGPVASVIKGTMVNCTVVGKCKCLDTDGSKNDKFNLFNGGSGIYCGNSGSVKNCVSTCVTNMNDVVTPFTGSAARFLNCAGDGGTVWGGTDCIDGTSESFFKDFSHGVYVPAAGGPLVHSGVEIPNAPSVDLAGNPRLIGRSIDIGCFEASEAGLRILIR